MTELPPVGSVNERPPPDAGGIPVARRESWPFVPDDDREPYLFVSYAHRDEVVVFSEISRLHEQGVRLWYDRGIRGGDNWEAEIYGKLDSPQCVGMLVFLSFQYLISAECRYEFRIKESLAGLDVITIKLEDHEPKLRAHADYATIRHVVRAFYVRFTGIQMLEKELLAVPEYKEHLLRAIPPRARSVRPVAPVGRDGEREVVVRYFLGVRRPGQTVFQALPEARGIPRDSKFKVLLLAETDCQGVLAIESLDKDRRRVSLDFHSPGRAGGAEYALREGVWDTIPAGGLLLEESHPRDVAFWRMGLLVWNPDRSVQVMRTLRSLRDGEAAGTPPDYERSIRMPLVTCKAFGLREFAPAISLEGRREMWHWTDVAFD